jgi:hypothetical protein
MSLSRVSCVLLETKQPCLKHFFYLILNKSVIPIDRDNLENLYMYVWMCVSLAPELLDGFIHILVFKSYASWVGDW